MTKFRQLIEKKQDWWNIQKRGKQFEICRELLGKVRMEKLNGNKFENYRNWRKRKIQIGKTILLIKCYHILLYSCIFYNLPESNLVSTIRNIEFNVLYSSCHHSTPQNILIWGNIVVIIHFFYFIKKTEKQTKSYDYYIRH